MTSTVLLDANVLIALAVQEHEHHVLVADWIGSERSLAVSPIVEGALVRYLTRIGVDPASTTLLLARLHESPRLEFWPDEASYADVDLTGVVGYRQVTDVYLVALAERRDAKIVTLDEGLARLRPSVVELVGS